MTVTIRYRTTSTPAPASATPVSPRNLGEVRARLDAMSKADGKDRTLYISAINSVAKAFGGSPADLPSDPAELRRKLTTMSAAMAGMTKGSWSSVRSRLLAALRDTNVPVMRGRRAGHLAPAWAALYAKAPIRQRKARLSRFFGFCSAQGYSPEDVCDGMIERFHAALETTSLRGSPNDISRAAARGWNEAARTIEGWPNIILTEYRPERGGYVLDLDAFLPSFQASVAAYLEYLRDPPEDDDTAPTRGLKPTTLEMREFNIRQIASALVHSGIGVERLRTIADLPSREFMDLVCEFFARRLGRPDATQIRMLLDILRSLARWQCKDETLARAISRRASKLSGRTGRRVGMTEKNRRRLAPFYSEKMVRDLLMLPMALASRASKAEFNRRAAVMMRNAVALEIELMCPIRLANIANLSVEDNLIRHKIGRRTVTRLYIPGRDVKNGEDIEMELPPHTAELIDRYVAEFRPLLIEPEHRHATPRSLFPKFNSQPQSGKVLAGSICDVLKAELGLDFNFHLFRHLGCMLYLKTHPDGFEVMRRVLAHRQIETTIRFYAEIQQTQAFAEFDRAILSLRGSKPKARPAQRRTPATRTAPRRDPEEGGTDVL